MTDSLHYEINTSDQVEHNGQIFFIEFDLNASESNVHNGEMNIIYIDIWFDFLVADNKIDWTDPGIYCVGTGKTLKIHYDWRGYIPQAIIDSAEVILRKIRMRAFS